MMFKKVFLCLIDSFLIPAIDINISKTPQFGISQLLCLKTDLGKANTVAYIVIMALQMLLLN